jgi:outer membrane lipopolysaccharide assembly protein LptE/RlpB
MKKTAVVLCFVILSACGYQWVGRETHLPPGVGSIAIPTFVNQTFEPGIEVTFTQAFLREFIQDRRVRVVDRREADSILEGVVKLFTTTPVTFDESGIATQYQTTLIIDLTLKKGTGEVLWREKDLSESRWYRSSTSALVSEANKAAAIQQIGGFVAERIRNRFFSNF